MYVPVISISTFPKEIILCEDESEGDSTSFTSIVELEITDEGCSSSVVGGSVYVLVDSPTSFLKYPRPA